MTKKIDGPGYILFSNWMAIAPDMIIINPNQVAFDMFSLDTSHPNTTFTRANNATWTPSNFEKSDFTRLTAAP
jgi:hypothetical protein